MSCVIPALEQLVEHLHAFSTRLVIRYVERILQCEKLIRQMYDWQYLTLYYLASSRMCYFNTCIVISVVYLCRFL